MKTFLQYIVLAFLLNACASTPGEPTVKRSQIRDCPPGWVLICETRRQQDPSQGGDEEIPVYDFCRCDRLAN
jgi:hypothetical protein